MAIKFKRDKEGHLVAIDEKTNKKLGIVSTMGDSVTKEPSKKTKNKPQIK